MHTFPKTKKNKKENLVQIKIKVFICLQCVVEHVE